MDSKILSILGIILIFAIIGYLFFFIQKTDETNTPIQTEISNALSSVLLETNSEYSTLFEKKLIELKNKPNKTSQENNLIKMIGEEQKQNELRNEYNDFFELELSISCSQINEKKEYFENSFQEKIVNIEEFNDLLQTEEKIETGQLAQEKGIVKDMFYLLEELCGEENK